MRYLTAILIAPLLLVSLTIGTQAEQPLLTGKQLAEFCQKTPTENSNPGDDWQPLACVSFIYGFTIAHQMTMNFQPGAKHHEEFKPLYCAPKDISVGLFQTIFNAYAISNPTKLDQPAENSLLAAFTMAFPCPWLDELLKHQGK